MPVLETILDRYQPTRRWVLACSAAASLLIVGTAAADVIASKSEVTLEIDGVAMPVTTWQDTAGGVLDAAGITVGAHDLVLPALNETVGDGDVVVVRTAHPYTLTIDGQAQTVWSTAANAEAILTDAGSFGNSIHLAADRSASRGTPIPLVATTKSINVSVANTDQLITAEPGIDARTALENAGITVSPIDRVTVSYDSAGLHINVDQVQRGAAVRTEETPFSVTETPSTDLFQGERVVQTAGVVGITEKDVWHETVNGQDTHLVETGTRSTTEAVNEVVLVGTKEVTPEALIAAGIDPKATLEEGTEANGNASIRYRARLGTLSTSAEIAAIVGDSDSSEAAAAAMSAGVPLVYSGEDPKAIAQTMVAARGWDDSQFQCLVVLWQRESGWNPYAENRSSGAYGIPQSLPGSKMASAGADWRTNPATQITWGLGYIAGRYGTPCGALAHSNSVGWY
ncbi:ubiquitin-like domain-containing protein [Schaalia suimastitidis]|uniref:aggregation-promoting factor C-terminal-like domain-containing protein n=1 Tax=Schaalia suimastitidis TaxID=121163 RepID=UPI00068727A1|nr:ubiquitin-like domain-containing protein [Schaalia suimastitidis]